MNKKIILAASLLGALAVILGAFGAHGREGTVSTYHIETWKTANQYHFYPPFALLFLSTFSRAKTYSIKVSFIAFLIGILFFSGSLYVLSVREITGFGNPSILGPITPLGGLSLIVGWVALFIAALKNKS